MVTLIHSLPRELVQRVFRASCTKSGRPAVGIGEDTELVLSLRDRCQLNDSELHAEACVSPPPGRRCRCQAVCRAWREWLSPARFPIPHLHFDGHVDLELQWALEIDLPVDLDLALIAQLGEEERCAALMHWASRTQPAVQSLSLNLSGRELSDPLTVSGFMALASIQPRTALEEVRLSMKCSLVSWLLPALPLFPRIRGLEIFCDEEDGRPTLPLDVPLLSGLPCLEELEVEEWKNALFTHTFTALTSLVLCQIDEVVLDTDLPSLQYLLLHFVNGARVRGEQLRLPRLTSLLLYEVQRAALDYAAVPVLEELAFHHIDKMECHNGGSFSSLTRLSYLNLSDAHDNVEMAALLRLAPPSLRSMCVRGWGTDAEASALAACGGQLTSLYCWRPAIVPALGPLRQLEELEVHASAAELAKHCAVLGGLPCLRKLICHNTARLPKDSSADLKRLASALPKGCVVVEEHKPES